MSCIVFLYEWEILFEYLLWQLGCLRLFHHLTGNVVFPFYFKNRISYGNL